MRFEIGRTPARSFDGLTVIHRVRRLRAVRCDCTIVASGAGVRIEGLWPVMNAGDGIEFAAVLLVSVKIIWMIHRQAKIDHFQFWILNSIEFQMTMISRRLTSLEETTAQAARDRAETSTATLRT